MKSNPNNILDGLFERGNVQYFYKDSTNKCMREFPIKELVGEGRFGSVFVTCIAHNCNYIVKLVPLHVFIPTTNCDLSRQKTSECESVSKVVFEQEIKFSKLFSDLDIGPKFLVGGICDGIANKYQDYPKGFSVGFIVQEKWDMSLEDYAYQFPDKTVENYDIIEKILLTKAHKFDEYGHFHWDLHAGNVLLRLDKENNVVDLTPTDFGFMEKGDADNTTTKTAELSLQNLKDKLKQFSSKRHKA